MKSEISKITGLGDREIEALTGDQVVHYFADWFDGDKEKAIDTMGVVGKEGLYDD